MRGETLTALRSSSEAEEAARPPPPTTTADGEDGDEARELDERNAAAACNILTSLGHAARPLAYRAAAALSDFLPLVLPMPPAPTLLLLLLAQLPPTPTPPPPLAARASSEASPRRALRAAAEPRSTILQS